MADLGAIGISRQTTFRDVRPAGSSVTRVSRNLAKIVYRQNILIGTKRGAGKYVTRQTVRGNTNRYYKRIPWWTSDARPLHTIPTDSAISGIIKKESVVLPYALVSLYYHKNGNKVETVRADASGTFTFRHLDSTDYYFALATDTAYPPTAFNAKVFDFLSPIKY